MNTSESIISHVIPSHVRGTLTWRVFTNAGWASAAIPINVGLGIVQTGLMARMLGPEGIGTIALFGAVCVLLGSVLKVASAEPAMTYVIQALTEGDDAQASHFIRYFYLLDFLTSLVAFSAVALSALFVPRLLNLAPGLEWLQALFGLTLVFQSTYWTSHALLRVADRFSWTFYHSVVHSVTKTALVALLFVAKAGLTEVAFLLVGLSLLDGLSLYLMARLALRRKGLRHVRQSVPWWHVPGEIRRFQMLGYGRQLIKSMNRSADTLMIGYIGSPLQVGFYRAGKQIADQAQLPVQGFLVSLFPEYSRLYFSGDIHRLRRLVGRFFSLFLGLGLLASLVLWFGAERIIRIILGDGFLPAKDVVRIVMISAVVRLVMSSIYPLPAAVGRAGPALRSMMAAIGVQVVVIFWLVPRQGALGAAWANVAYFVTWAVVLLPSVLKVLQGPGAEAGQGKSEVRHRKVEPADVA